MLLDLVMKNRSYRRFDESFEIKREQLDKLVELARICPSSRNQQALRFKLVNNKDIVDQIFPMLAWAGYLKDWDGPPQGERPSSYIIILGDINRGSDFAVDMGIVGQTMLLGATEMGLGGCMIGSIRKASLTKLLDLPEHLKILLIIAIGKPIEKVVIDECLNNDIKYWRDDLKIHHVPKRSIGDLLL